VINYFFFVANDVRQILAAMGYQEPERDCRAFRASRKRRVDQPLEG
jgi:glutamate synthase domain-containing protein 2